MDIEKKINKKIRKETEEIELNTIYISLLKKTIEDYKKRIEISKLTIKKCEKRRKING